TAVCAASSRSATSTVPLNVIDIAPILTLISALACSALVRSSTLPPSTHGITRSRSRIASQLYSVGFPVWKLWSSSTIVGLLREGGVDRDSDVVGDLEGAEQRRVRGDAPGRLLDRGAAGEVAGVEL